MTAREPYEKLWSTAVTFQKYYDKWMNGPILEVNAEVVEEEVSYSFNVPILILASSFIS